MWPRSRPRSAGSRRAGCAPGSNSRCPHRRPTSHRSRLAVGGRPTPGAAFPVAPFDSTGQRFFYVDADDAFSAGGSVARLRVRLSRPGVAPPGLALNWSYQVGDDWLPLGRSGPGTTPPPTGLRDETRGLTRDGTVTLPVPMSWPRSMYRTPVGRWLRIDVTGDGYTTTPEIASLRWTSDGTCPG